MTYGTAHQLVRKTRGRAADYDCAHCRAKAQEWAYDHNDPDEMPPASSASAPYPEFSCKPEHYIPLCRSCHRLFDSPVRRRAIAEGREDVLMRLDGQGRARENQVRRIAKRRGLEARKSPRRDVKAIDYNRWSLTRPGGVPVVKGRVGFVFTLDEIEQTLATDATKETTR